MAPLSKALAFAFVLALPLAANAQVTAHKLTIKIKGVAQTTSNSGDLKPEKFSGSAKDVFELCVGTAPTKKQGLYLFLDCADPNTNVIAAMDTDPVELLDAIGGVDFDVANAVVKEKNGEAQSVTVPAAVLIDCGGVGVLASGIVDLKLKDLEGEQCAQSAKMKLSGVGNAGDDFILNTGSAINAQKRTAAFSNSFPPLP